MKVNGYEYVQNNHFRNRRFSFGNNASYVSSFSRPNWKKLNSVTFFCKSKEIQATPFLCKLFGKLGDSGQSPEWPTCKQQTNGPSNAIKSSLTLATKFIDANKKFIVIKHRTCSNLSRCVQKRWTERKLHIETLTRTQKPCQIVRREIHVLKIWRIAWKTAGNFFLKTVTKDKPLQF